MIRRLLPVALLTIAAAPLAAQGRADFHWDKAVAAGGTVSIHNINGDIKVVASTTGRVNVTGIKRGGNADRLRVDVREFGHGVSICVINEDNDDECTENGMNSHSHGGNHSWDHGQIDLEVAVPTNLSVSPNTVSGDISVTGAQGDLNANSVSGDITLDRIHPISLRANTVSGDVKVSVVEFMGRGDLQFHSVSGDISLDLPRDFAADLSMSTVSGDVDSDFAITLGNSRMSRRSISGRIGAGGRKLDVSTVSGDLKLRTSK
jgi:DUF4097 and DUF4098 domain-containing protein YvlB